MTENSKRTFSVGKVAAVVVIAVSMALCIAVGPTKKQEDQGCEEQAAARRRWINEKSMAGYSPSAFGMYAWGKCAHVLRIHEDDCSTGNLIARYGSKPFMIRAKELGFDKISCGYDEYDLTVITGN